MNIHSLETPLLGIVGSVAKCHAAGSAVVTKVASDVLAASELKEEEIEKEGVNEAGSTPSDV